MSTRCRFLGLLSASPSRVEPLGFCLDNDLYTAAILSATRWNDCEYNYAAVACGPRENADLEKKCWECQDFAGN